MDTTSTSIPHFALSGSVSRLEILRFMVACEQFLTFVRLNGGEKGLTMDERHRIMTYQRMISALLNQPQQAKHDDSHV
jgi:hypothetical protein